MSFRLSTSAESGILRQPGPPNAPNTASIANSTCKRSGSIRYDADGDPGAVGDQTAADRSDRRARHAEKLDLKRLETRLLKHLDKVLERSPEGKAK